MNCKKLYLLFLLIFIAASTQAQHIKRVHNTKPSTNESLLTTFKYKRLHIQFSTDEKHWKSYTLKKNDSLIIDNNGSLYVRIKTNGDFDEHVLKPNTSSKIVERHQNVGNVYRFAVIPTDDNTYEKSY